MIHSMTGYARKEFKGDWGTAVWEIRSVNQRYLETYYNPQWVDAHIGDLTPWKAELAQLLNTH